MNDDYNWYITFLLGFAGGMFTAFALIFFVPMIEAKAAPVAGVTAKIYEQHTRAPIAPWQQDILETINEEPTKEESNARLCKTSTRRPKKEKRKDCNRTTNGRNRNCLTRRCGIFNGPSGKETYYNLPMGRCIQYMEDLDYNYRYWIREDGVKMYGDYVMCAADLSIRPKGTIVETSLGKGIVCDTGSFVNQNRYQLDIATTW